MLLNRIKPYIDPLLRPNQNGFRPDRSIIEHILALRKLIERIKSHDINVVIILFDFKKAIDSIDRGKMLEIVAECGITSTIINSIELLWYESRIIISDGET